MSAAPTGRVRTPLGWLDAAVVVGSAITGGACAATLPGTVATVLVALGAVLVAWFAFGRRAENGGTGWWALLGVVVAASYLGSTANPTFATFQVVAFPLAWMIAPRFAEGFVVNLLTAAAIAEGYARATGPAQAVVVEALSVGFSVAMGAWVSRIVRRSDERQALVDRLTAAQDEVAALNREAGTVAERERLARELHDTLAQSLAGVVMLAERARARHPADTGLGVLEDAARQAMGEARGLVAAGAAVPMEGGLAAALEVLAARFRRETGMSVRVEAGVEVPRSLEVVLLRCAQEGFANVRKHASAASVRLSLTGEAGDALLRLEDDGRGPGDGRGFGLDGMRDRLALVGGSLALRAGAAGGSVLTVRVPVPAPEGVRS